MQTIFKSRMLHHLSIGLNRHSRHPISVLARITTHGADSFGVELFNSLSRSQSFDSSLEKLGLLLKTKLFELSLEPSFK